MTNTKIQQHSKANPKVRCCWICGKTNTTKLGANVGFTNALRFLGYDVEGQVAHAHMSCIEKELKKRK